MSGGAPLDPSGLIAVAICHGFGLFVAVAIGANISGGHVNPAVTFGLALGGQITILTGIFYWVAQLLGAIVGAFLVQFCTGVVRNISPYIWARFPAGGPRKRTTLILTVFFLRRPLHTGFPAWAPLRAS